MLNLGKYASATLLAFFGLTETSYAEEIYTPPEGCTAFLTVQSEGCEMDILWRCDLAPAGDTWDAFFDQSGVQSIGSYSSQFAWLDVEYMWDNSTETATGIPTDPISAAVLALSGRDTYQFDMQRTDDSGTRLLHVKGVDTLTSTEVVIDGLTLQGVEFDLTITEDDGTVFYMVNGTQYFSPEHQLFFSNVANVTTDDGIVTYQTPPVDFIFPGEPGFADPTPLYGCSSPAIAQGDSPTASTAPVATPTTAPAPPEAGIGKNNNK